MIATYAFITSSAVSTRVLKALASAPFLSALARQPSAGWSQAPRPGRLLFPSKTARGGTELMRAIRVRSCCGAVSRQPMQVRTGVCSLDCSLRVFARYFHHLMATGLQTVRDQHSALGLVTSIASLAPLRGLTAIMLVSSRLSAVPQRVSRRIQQLPWRPHIWRLR